MKRFTSFLAAALTMLTAASAVRADVHSLCYGGQQPWWNIFAHKNKCMTDEEKRLQRFWHDYYDALHRYYRSLDRIDWVAYYKNHGYQINGCGTAAYGSYAPNGQFGPQQCGAQQPIQFAPVMVTPQLQWAAPNGACSSGPAMGMGGMGAFNGYGQ